MAEKNRITGTAQKEAAANICGCPGSPTQPDPLVRPAVAAPVKKPYETPYIIWRTC